MSRETTGGTFILSPWSIFINVFHGVEASSPIPGFLRASVTKGCCPLEMPFLRQPRWPWVSFFPALWRVTCDVDFLGPERPGVLGVNPTLWHVSLFMEQWIRVTSILLRILRGDSWQVLVSDFPFCDVLIWHWREGNPDLMEWVGKRFPLFCFLRRVWEGLVLISL